MVTHEKGLGFVLQAPGPAYGIVTGSGSVVLKVYCALEKVGAIKLKNKTKIFKKLNFNKYIKQLILKKVTLIIHIISKANPALIKFF